MQEKTSTAVSLLPAEIPSNLYKPTSPLKVKVVENTRLTAPGSENDVRHIVLNFAGSNYWYLEGQSAGILPPGTDATGKPHKLRLYSIASEAIGDDGKGNSLSLCVKRVEYKAPETGELKKGVCSSYLCDLKPGDEVNLCGPTGKGFLMPDMPDANMIMIGTGTGIAPFRGFVRNRYGKRAGEKGQTWVFLGVPYKSDYLYGAEFESYRQHEGYHFVTAFSREEKTADGRKMYVQERLTEHRDALLDLLLKPNTFLYICGLRGMEAGILEALDKAAVERGLSWKELHAKLETEKRWRVEVY